MQKHALSLSHAHHGTQYVLAISLPIICFPCPEFAEKSKLIYNINNTN